MNDRLNGIYKTQPIKFIDGIPIFSENNEYIENYEKISVDHIAATEKTGINPFISEDLWLESEKSTRDLILKYFTQTSSIKVLDAGVGMGRLLALLPTSFEKYGMDISMGYLKISKSKGTNVCLSAIEDMPYQENAFDLVICTDVLEHVLDLNLACNKLFSVLKENGMLIARVPYRENLDSYVRSVCPYKFSHLRSFDEHSLRLLFENVFQCEVIEYKKAVYRAIRPFFKYSLPLRGDILFSSIIYPAKFISKKAYEYFVRKLYHPYVINIVVKKRPTMAITGEVTH